MSAHGYCRAVTVGFVVFAGTLLFSNPMVAVYATLKRLVTASIAHLRARYP